MIDVREPAEVARERVAIARLAPLSRFDPAALELGDAKRVVMLCAVGVRSVKAGAQLAARGGPEIVNLKGGLAAWKQAGLPVVIAAPPRPVRPALTRQTLLLAGALIALGAALGALVNPWLLALCAVGIALPLARLAYKRR